MLRIHVFLFLNPFVKIADLGVTLRPRRRIKKKKIFRFNTYTSYARNKYLPPWNAWMNVSRVDLVHPICSTPRHRITTRVSNSFSECQGSIQDCCSWTPHPSDVPSLLISVHPVIYCRYIREICSMLVTRSQQVFCTPHKVQLRKSSGFVSWDCLSVRKA